MSIVSEFKKNAVWDPSMGYNLRTVNAGPQVHVLAINGATNGPSNPPGGTHLHISFQGAHCDPGSDTPHLFLQPRLCKHDSSPG